jgi:hypothetical protein
VFLLSFLPPYVHEIPLEIKNKRTDEQAFSMGLFNDALYIGTRNKIHGASLLRMDQDERVLRQVSMNPENIDIYGLITYNNWLYIGTYNKYGGELWRMNSTGDMERIFRDGLDDVENRDIWSITRYNRGLLIGTWNRITGGKIYQSNDGRHFFKIYDVADPGGGYIRCFARFKGSLYASVGNRCNPLHLIKLFTKENLKLNVPANRTRSDIYTMLPFNKYLYIGVAAYHAANEIGGCEVWRFDGSTFIPSIQGGFGNPNNTYVGSMIEWKDWLVCSTQNYHNGCELWATRDGYNWLTIAMGGFGLGKYNEAVFYGLSVFHGNLYIATRNAASGMHLYAIEPEILATLTES